MRHDILLWKKPSALPLSQQIKQAFSTLSVFQDLGAPFTPKYQTVWRLEDATEFEWTLDNFEAALMANPVNANLKQLGELGYLISFFSDLDMQKSLGFSLEIGNQSPRFFDTIVIRFPEGLLETDRQFAKFVPKIFSECIKRFSPTWGCVLEVSFLKKYGIPFLNGVPTTVQWINYWTDEVVDRIGRKRVAKFLSKYGLSRDEGIIILQPEPMNLAESSTLALCEEMNRELKSNGGIKDVLSKLWNQYVSGYHTF